MNRAAAVAALAVLLLAGGCGKMGPPRPPVIRTPQTISDLRATQSGENIVLTWTNPPSFIDGNPATDLAAVRVLRNGVEVASVAPTAPGQPQSFVMDASNSQGVEQTFAVQVEPRRGKPSAVSTPATIQPVEVPGAVESISAGTDQNRIRLDWQPPGRDGNLADSYIVQRSDRPGPDVVSTTYFEDRRFEQGKSYVYTVTATRGGILGVAGPQLSVTAVDRNPPQTPVEVKVEPNAVGAFVTWRENTEEDFRGYWIYRSDRRDSGFVLVKATLHPINSLNDPEYRPGLYYAVSAEDFFGNKSDPSEPQR